MPNLGLNELAALVEKSRTTVKKLLDGVPFEEGPNNKRIYRGATALERIYLGRQDETTDKEDITNIEAQRQLTIARKEQIDLEMEVTRKERWPKEDVEEIHESALSNVAGLLKAHEGKTLSTVLIQDIFTELRSVGAALAKL